MCCQIETRQGCGHQARHHDSSHCCEDHSYFGRRFWTKEERIGELEQYLESLRMEVKAVEEHIAALKKE